MEIKYRFHRYTITSRDSEVREFDTEQEAIQSWQDSRKSYRSIGYVVWFAIKVIHVLWKVIRIRGIKDV